jgi:hypothetical protein
MYRPADNRAVVLLLEDEALIALNLQDEFQDAGFRVAGPCATCSDSGHRADRDLLADCHEITWMEKPVSSSMLITECKRLLTLAA